MNCKIQKRSVTFNPVYTREKYADPNDPYLSGTIWTNKQKAQHEKSPLNLSLLNKVLLRGFHELKLEENQARIQMDMGLQSNEVKTSKLVQLSDCNLLNKTLLSGELLKWMDILACLAAEKHAESPCVTASVDDLNIEQSVSCGMVVNMKAKVNRAFNTSMEIEVHTDSEDLTNGESNRICRAFFTFVTQPDSSGKRPTIKPTNPETEEEKMQYLLASERKKMRLDYRNTLQEMKRNSFDENYFLAAQGYKDAVVSPSSTVCESVEIVLPQHANHHKTTFGGQLMAWMEANATISARRLCRTQPLLVAVDEVFFRAPSKVGDRIVITSMVNNTFTKSLEVGVRVDAYAVGGKTRHIESAYFTFISPDEKGNPVALPSLKPDDEKQRARMARALRRVTLRQERRTILSCEESIVSTPWTHSNSLLISYQNIKSLLEIYRSTAWQLAATFENLKLFQGMKGKCLVVKGEIEVAVPAKHAYRYLLDEKRRPEWDGMIIDVKVVEEFHYGSDALLHYVMLNRNPRQRMKSDDFVMIVSRRPSRDKSEPFTIAYRSVTLESLPQKPEYNRAENLCSGFLIEPAKADGNCCKIVYINQLTKEVYEYVKGDLKGVADVHEKRSEKLISKLLESFADENTKV